MASDLTPELLEAGRARARAAGVELEWVEADAEHLPFDDASFDVVMSAIGVMFAPHHQEAADELVRVCRPGGTIGLLNWTPEGMLGALFRADGAVRAAAAARRAAAAAVGRRGPPARALRRARDSDARARDPRRSPRSRTRSTTASTSRPATARRSPSAPTPRKTGREAEFDAALDACAEDWNRGTAGAARFEMEYLLTVGTAADPAPRAPSSRSAAAPASRREEIAELAQHRRDVVIDGLGRDHERPRDLARSWRPRTIRSSTSVSRGVSPAGPAREAARGRAGCGARHPRAGAAVDARPRGRHRTRRTWRAPPAARPPRRRPRAPPRARRGSRCPPTRPPRRASPRRPTRA